MSLLDQPVDIQVQIFQQLPIKSVLQLCRTNRYFQNLCQTRLDDYFRQLTRDFFGIPNKFTKQIERNWYLTFLTIYNDVMKTTDILINKYEAEIHVEFKKYITIKTDLLREDTAILVANLLKKIMNENRFYQADEEDSKDENLFSPETLFDDYGDERYEIAQKLAFIDRLQSLELSGYYDGDNVKEPQLEDILCSFIKKYLPRKILSYSSV